MSRIRTIKPEFWSSEQVMACSRAARLLFIGIWNFADDAGRFRWKPLTLKAQILPGDEDVSLSDVTGWLNELASAGLLVKYGSATGGVHDCYGSIPGWQHQRIQKPSPSKYPAPDENTKIQVGLPDRSSSSTVGLPDGSALQGYSEKEKDPPLSTPAREAGRPIDFPDFEPRPANDQRNWPGEVMGRFRSLHLKAFAIEPNMGGRQVHAFPGQLEGTAKARGVDPIQLLDDTFKLWSSQPRDKIARGSPYAAFCARFGELVGATHLDGDTSASDRLLAEISKARRAGDLKTYDRLDDQWARQFGGKK